MYVMLSLLSASPIPFFLAGGGGVFVFVQPFHVLPPRLVLLPCRQFAGDADPCSSSPNNSLKYTADEARSLKAYGELPENAKINETDTFGGGEDGDCAFEFDEDRDSESGEEAGAGGKEVDIDDI